MTADDAPQGGARDARPRLNESEASTDGARGTSGDTETMPREIGGRGGADPTRYGDWEKKGRCIDF
ncbi:MAG: DUF1674 domain-containing protein [Arenicellales bacterium]